MNWWREAGLASIFLRRALLALPVFGGLLLLNFALLHVPDGAGHVAGGKPLTGDEVARYRTMYRLDEPVLPRFGSWLAGIARGDFGRSIRSDRPVRDILGEALAPTLLLQVPAFLIMLGVGIPLGVAAARRSGRRFDRWSRISSLFFHSMPDYWLATLLLLVFATNRGLDLFPFGGLHDRDADTFSSMQRLGDLVHHLVLPVMALAAGGIAVISRHVRDAMIETLATDHIRTLRASGLSENRIVWKYALKSGLVSTATLLGAMIPTLVGGSVIIENIFDIKGMGRLVYRATFAHDYSVLQALFFVTAGLTLVGYVISDLIVAWLAPRTRWT